jgi:2-polyprenyl-3-methyl-5-hydroxy-6-metoxy-1,4-benzoquinol methylase
MHEKSIYCSNIKFRQQDFQYVFPYHHIPHMDQNGNIKRIKALPWGFEYLCYLYHTYEVLQSLKPSSVLEVGCGDGRFIGLLSNVERRVGVDISEKAIRFGKAFHDEVDFVVTDVSNIRETFDVVVAIEVLEHIPDAMLNSFWNSLDNKINKDGHLIICVPSSIVRINKKHYRHYTLDMIKKEIRQSDAKLRIVTVEYIFKKNSIMGIFDRLSFNRFFYLDIHCLTNIIWKYCWNRLRFGNEYNGRHIVITLRKY